VTRRQLEADTYNYESGEDFDHEEDFAQYEHYRVYGDKPRLMPDLGMFRDSFHPNG